MTSCSHIADFEKLEKIGEGSYGIVYKARNLITGETVAMKKIRLDSGEEGLPSTTTREVAMLMELKHQNIVDLQSIIMDEEKLFLIFEFVSMDLKKYMDKYYEQMAMPTRLVTRFMHQIMTGMNFCHSRRIMHRDLKPQNILIDIRRGIIKLADFGLARVVGLPIRAYTHEVFTLWYRAPEILLGAERYSFAADIWSIGCIFAEMTRGRPIFRGDCEIDQLFQCFKLLGTPTEAEWPGVTKMREFKPTFPQWSENNLPEKMGAKLTADGLDFLQQMFIYNPNKRISAKKALEHPYFKAIGGQDSEKVASRGPNKIVIEL